MDVAMSKIPISPCGCPPPIPKPHINPTFPFLFEPINGMILVSRRFFILSSCFSSFVTVSSAATAETPPSLSYSNSSNSFLSGIANTKSWFQFYGDGFAIRVPPTFQDIMEPEDYNAGLSLYGDKAKPKMFAARFASADGKHKIEKSFETLNFKFIFRAIRPVKLDSIKRKIVLHFERSILHRLDFRFGSEVLSVVVRPSNQLKITFLEAKDITDFGSLKEAAKIFVPGGSTLYSARTIKIKEEEGYRNYYFYEFGRDEQHIALVAGVNSGKAIIAGATAPQDKWDTDGVRLRSAAVSLTLL